MESALEQKRLARHNLLLDCKIQELPVILLSGDLMEISEVQVGPGGSRQDLEVRALLMCLLQPVPVQLVHTSSKKYHWRRAGQTARLALCLQPPRCFVKPSTRLEGGHCQCSATCRT